MWIFVFFDLPVTLKKERKAACKFRNDLLKDGFTMLQYSVYIRHCASKESVDVHTSRVKAFMPEKGQVSILFITDKQYSEILNFWGIKTEKLPDGPKQLEIF